MVASCRTRPREPLRALLRLAWREARASRRRLLLLVAAIATGTAALVAINTFTANLRTAVAGEARSLLGADLALASRTAPGDSLFAARRFARLWRRRPLRRAGHRHHLRRHGLCARPRRRAPGPRHRGRRRLAVLRHDHHVSRRRVEPPAISPGCAGRPGLPHRARRLSRRHARRRRPAPADCRDGGSCSRRCGHRDGLRPAGVHPRRACSEKPASCGSARARSTTHTSGFPRARTPRPSPKPSSPRSGPSTCGFARSQDEQRNLGNALDRLGRFLGLVALVALLLGGIGVGSAVHVLIRQKMDTVAVLRCLGGSTRQVFGLFLVQAAGIGLIGSVIGAALGLAVEQALPRVLGDFLPVAVSHAVSWPAASRSAWGSGSGPPWRLPCIPLLGVRHISPLATLRRPYEPATRVRRVTAGRSSPRSRSAPVSVLMAVLQAGQLLRGAAFAVGIGAGHRSGSGLRRSRWSAASGAGSRTGWPTSGGRGWPTSIARQPDGLGGAGARVRHVSARHAPAGPAQPAAGAPRGRRLAPGRT